MACEEPCVCEKFQSAICSHCNHRLCREHIAEHQMIVNNLTTCLSDSEIVSQQIKKESQKRKDMYGSILASANKWRRLEMEKIDDIYRNYMKTIDSERMNLENSEMKLCEQLESHACKPLTHLKSQKDVTMKSIDDIKQIIHQVRVDNRRLQWPDVPKISSSIDSEHPSKSISCSKNSSTCNGRPLKTLINMLSKISSEKDIKKKITDYLKNLHKDFRLPTVICTYLTAWYKKTKTKEKNLLLNETAEVIKKYSNKSESDFDVLFGLQAFIIHQEIGEDRIEIMTFLLQFFLDHQCINKLQLFKWFKSEDSHVVHAYKGFQQAKKLATPFIRSLEAKQTAVDLLQSTKHELIVID